MELRKISLVHKSVIVIRLLGDGSIEEAFFKFYNRVMVSIVIALNHLIKNHSGIDKMKGH